MRVGMAAGACEAFADLKAWTAFSGQRTSTSLGAAHFDFAQCSAARISFLWLRRQKDSSEQGGGLLGFGWRGMYCVAPIGIKM